MAMLQVNEEFTRILRDDEKKRPAAAAAPAAGELSPAAAATSGEGDEEEGETAMARKKKIELEGKVSSYSFMGAASALRPCLSFCVISHTFAFGRRAH